MVAKLQWERKLLTLCVLFAISGGAVVNKDPSPTEAPPDGQNLTLTLRRPDGHLRMTLQPGDYEILPNGTLHVLSRANLTGNSSSDDEVGGLLDVVCFEGCRDRPLYIKPIYYGFVSAFLHFQVPFYICGSRSFNRWTPLAYVVFLYCLAMAFVTAPLCRLPEYPSYSFVALWYSLPSYLSLSGALISGWLTVLHSNSGLAHLAEAGIIYVKKGTVFITKRDYILKGTACTGAAMFMVTYALVLSGFYSKTAGRPENFSSLRNHMPYFVPALFFYFFTNLVIFYRQTRRETPASISDVAWLPIREKYVVFLRYFVAAFINWMLGFSVTVNGWWWLWDPFVLFSASYPAALCCYVFYTSRRVIYANRRCVKILETDGEIVTVWSERPNKSKPPLEKETNLAAVVPAAKELAENTK